MARRRHPFLEKNAKVGRVSRRRDGVRPSGEPMFNHEEQEGVLWKKARKTYKDDTDDSPNAK